MPTAASHPWLEIMELGDTTIVRFTQPRIITESDIKPLGDVLLGLVDDPSCRKLVVSLAGVELMSSAMVGKLIALQRKIKAAGGRMLLCSATTALDRVFEVGGLRRVFDLRQDQTAAILALNSNPKT